MIKILSSNVVIICVTFFLTACASTSSNPTFGPVKGDNFQSIYAESIGVDAQEIIFYSRAIWYPNKNGFKFLPAGKKSRKGVIVYTRKGVYFSEWSAKKYTTVFSTDFQQVGELRLAVNDLFGRMVIKKDAYHSFEILGVTGSDLPDKDETEVAYQIIVQQR